MLERLVDCFCDCRCCDDDDGDKLVTARWLDDKEYFPGGLHESCEFPPAIETDSDECTTAETSSGFELALLSLCDSFVA